MTRLSKAYLEQHYAKTFEAFKNSPYFHGRNSLQQNLIDFLDNEDFYLLTQPIYNHRDVLLGYGVEIKRKGEIKAFADSPIKSYEKVEKAFLGSLLNEYEKYLTFGVVD